MRFPLGVPSGETLTDDFARELVSLLGYHAPDGSNNADDARVVGGGLATVYERLLDAALEGFTPSTTELLDGWEARLGVVSSSSASETTRRAALTAVRRAGGANSRARVLAALHALDPLADLATGSVLENLSYPRGVFVFSVRLAPATLASASTRTQLVDVLERMKPAHTTYRLSNREGFFTNDPNSLTDTVGDVLGS